MAAQPPSDSWLAEHLGRLDTCTDEELLRAAMTRASADVAAELRARRPAGELAAAWSTVLRHGVAAAVRLSGPADWTWFVSGSVARGEAAPGSDVETMAVLGDSVDSDGKTGLLTRAAGVHALLERCGIRGDANGVLASRPRFCRRLGSWTEGIEKWTADPRADRGVVMTGLVADSQGLPSNAALPEDALRAKGIAAAARNYPARQAMLQDATTVRAGVPSRLRLVVSGATTVDLKLAAVDPVVKLARWAALSAGSDALSTPTRLADAAAADLLDDDDAASLRDCFGWLLQYRWRLRAGPFFAGAAVGDVVSLAEMAPQERATLRSVGREVTGISRKLAYLASTSTYR